MTQSGGQELGIALMCTDWGAHAPEGELYAQLCRKLGVAFLDVSAVPGPGGLLDPGRAAEWEAVSGWVKLLIDAHRPANIAVVAQQKCARHPVDNDRHTRDVLETAIALKEKTAFGGRILAVVATCNSDKSWGLHQLADF